ncbi:MAG: multiubiquitin domain-containing protein [Pseudomonadota bacterium]
MKSNEIDIEQWARGGAQEQLIAATAYRVRLWDGDDFDEKRLIPDRSPTGTQILDAFDRYPVNEHVLLLLDRDGLHEIAPNQVIDIAGRGAERFFAFRTDRLWFGAFNDQRFPWGAPQISENMLRLIFRVSDRQEIVVTRAGEPDSILVPDDKVSLDDEGLERLFTRKSAWKLLVQGVTLTFDTPVIVVKDALIKAGIDPDMGWTAVLKFAGLPKEPVDLNDTIDLSRKGIEKLWLRPNHVNNGEAPSGLSRAFNLRDADVHFLEGRAAIWETLTHGTKRWFVLRGYELPAGYVQGVVDIAVLIPPTYPAAQLDMFYCAPHLQLANGRRIPATESRETIAGVSYQRWSRHRDARTAWNPATDSLVTHVALIEDAILREVEGN